MSREKPHAVEHQAPDDNVGKWDSTSFDNSWATHFPSPTKPSWPEGKAGDVTVNTASLRDYAKTLRSLTTALKDARNRVGTVNIAAGAFPHAADLNTRVQGSGGDAGTDVKNATYHFCEKSIDALEAIATEVDKAAAAYEKTEDDNKVDAKALAENLSTAQAAVSAITAKK